MAREYKKLTAIKVGNLKLPGRYSDGGNLYLSISTGSRKRWVFLYRFNGRQHEFGLGSAAKQGISLAEARKRAENARQLISKGINPIIARSIDAKAAKIVPTFKTFAEEYIAAHRHNWRNAKHASQWSMTIERYCKPLHPVPVNQVSTDLILKILTSIWISKSETASRIRGRIECILDAAKAKGFLTSENPARWRGHLKSLLPARRRLARGHHAALPFDEIGQFIQLLRTKDSISALALEFAILTASRSGEVLGAKWSEFDIKKSVWIIPATRMKAGREHRVPLSKRAKEIINNLADYKKGEKVFSDESGKKQLSTMAMAMLLRRLNRGDVTVHGFRSTFRDWASETTLFSHETCESALAHQISNKAEAAYRRGDQFEKRRELMEAWSSFCGMHKNQNVTYLST